MINPRLAPALALAKADTQTLPIARRRGQPVDPTLRTYRNQLGVYVISDGSAVKIGLAGNAKRRLRLLQVGNASTLTLEYFSMFDDAVDREIRAHHRLSALRIRGEWFAATVAQARSAIED